MEEKEAHTVSRYTVSFYLLLLSFSTGLLSCLPSFGFAFSHSTDFISSSINNQDKFFLCFLWEIFPVKIKEATVSLFIFFRVVWQNYNVFQPAANVCTCDFTGDRFLSLSLFFCHKTLQGPRRCPAASFCLFFWLYFLQIALISLCLCLCCRAQRWRRRSFGNSTQ